MPNRPIIPQQYQYGTTFGYYPSQEDSMSSMFSMMMPMIMMVMLVMIMKPMLSGAAQTS